MRGLTFIEIIITITIVVILASASMSAYTAWIKKQKGEKDLNKMISILNSARYKSTFEKRICGICWDNPNNIKEASLLCDTDGNGNLLDEGSINLGKSVFYFGFNSTNNIRCIKFQTEGTTTTWTSLKLTVPLNLPYNCIKVSYARIIRAKCI